MTIRFIDKPEVLERVPLCFTSIWHKMRKGEFPRSRDVGGKAMWVESEIDDWIASRPIRRLKGDPSPETPNAPTRQQKRRRPASVRARA